MYIIVRADLEPGYQLAQSVHAGQHFIFEHFEKAREWNVTSDTLACLSILNEEKLLDLLHKAEQAGILTSAFREPDLNNELTCIALEPGEIAQKLCSGLPLALKRLKKD